MNIKYFLQSKVSRLLAAAALLTWQSASAFDYRKPSPVDPLTSYEDIKYGSYVTGYLTHNQLGYFVGAKKSLEVFVQRPMEEINPGAVSYRLLINIENADDISIDVSVPRLTSPNWGNLYHYVFDISSFDGKVSTDASGTHLWGGEYRVYLLAKDANNNEWLPMASHDFMIYPTSNPGGATRLVSYYQHLARDAFNYYNFHRIGTAAMQNTDYARKSLHGAAVPCYKDWCGNGVVNSTDLKIGAGTGWADAGDFGLYPVNHAMAAWQLLNAAEFSLKFGTPYNLGTPGEPAKVADVAAGDEIKVNNKRLILVDETAIGSNYMLDFQKLFDTATVKLAPHRITDMDWGQGFSKWCITSTDPQKCSTPEDAVVPNAELSTDRIENYKRRSAAPGSTAATYAVCRTAAHLARFYAMDSTKSAKASQWLKLANSAMTQADATPVRLFPSYYSTGNFSAIPDGGGPYADNEISDDQFACYTEIYLAGYKMGGASSTDTIVRANYSNYKSKMKNHNLFAGNLASTLTFDWKNVAPTAYMSLVVAANDLTTAEMNQFKNWLKNRGTDIYNAVANKDANPLWDATGHTWGSNSNVLNAGVIAAYASQLHKADNNSSSAKASAQGALKTMDYIMGQNSLRMSFVTGYGSIAETDTHDRWAYYLHVKDARKLKYPAGWLSGGPTGDAMGCFAGTENRVADGSEPWERATPFFYKNTAWQNTEATGVARDEDSYGHFNAFAKVYSDNAHGTLLSVEGLFKLYGSSTGSQRVKEFANALATFDNSKVLPIPDGWTLSKNHDWNYAKPETAKDAWCSKENTINYNSALLWMVVAAQSALPNTLR